MNSVTDDGAASGDAALARFVAAQAPVWPAVRAELAAGAKRSHWMWFVFPQIAGLGRSPTAQFYAIRDRVEAQAYLAHPLLGRRLTESAQALLAHAGRSAESILGAVDALKLKSSMTLFEAVSPTADTPFGAVLDAFYGGDRDGGTLRLLD